MEGQTQLIRRLNMSDVLRELKCFQPQENLPPHPPVSKPACTATPTIAAFNRLACRLTSIIVSRFAEPRHAPAGN